VQQSVEKLAGAGEVGTRYRWAAGGREGHPSQDVSAAAASGSYPGAQAHARDAAGASRAAGFNGPADAVTAADPGALTRLGLSASS